MIIPAVPIALATGCSGGAQSGDPGCVPFWDCGNNGVVNEADTAVIGYNWG